jgi:hypothetical protein
MCTIVFPKGGQGFRAEVKIGDQVRLIFQLRQFHTLNSYQ